MPLPPRTQAIVKQTICVDKSCKIFTLGLYAAGGNRWATTTQCLGHS